MNQNSDDKVLVLSSQGTPLSYTSPARARKLLKKGKAKVWGHKPFQIKLLKDESVNLVTCEGQNSIVNLDNVCRIELNGDRIMFFYVATTARDNWKFQSAEEAKKAFKALIANGNIRKIRSE